jgi:hypothetical protein
MSLTKKVNGIEVPLNAKEIELRNTESAANDPNKPEVKVKVKKEIIEQKRQERMLAVDSQAERVMLIVDAFKILLENVSDEGMPAKPELFKILKKLETAVAVEQKARELIAAVEKDPDTDVENGWPKV